MKAISALQSGIEYETPEGSVGGVGCSRSVVIVCGA